MAHGFPRLGWLGLGVMALGFGLDLVVHAGVAAASSFSPAQHLAHLVVLLGMVLVLGGVLADGVRRSSDRTSIGRSRRPGRSSHRAHR